MGRARHQVHQLAEQTSYVIKNHHRMNDTEVAKQARTIVTHLPKVLLNLSKVRASMTTNTETVVNPVVTPIDSMIRDPTTVEENQTLRHVMAQLWQAWANGQEPPTSIPGYGPFDNCGVGPSTTRPKGMPFRNNPIVTIAAPGVVIVTNDQNTPNVTNNPLPAQNNLAGMICNDHEYKLLGKMGKLFSKIGEEDMPLKSSEPVASLSMEGVNLDTKVLCVLGVSKGIQLKEPIFVKPAQQLPVTDSKKIVEEVDEARGLTRSGRCYSPEELRKGKMAQNIQVPLKKVVTEEEEEEFLKNIKKTPTQISLVSLLLYSEEHRRVLNKILNEAHVSKETTSNTNTFTDDELPTEGARHNRALFLIVKCDMYYVKRVMIDGGSGLKINPDIIHPNNVFVRAYDGLKWDTIGEIKLNMTIGPVDFMIVFQVMDMDTYCNFLLGRPWIHIYRVVPSTLHQVSFEAVLVDRFKKGDLIIQPCLSSSSSMVAMTMLKYGYQPGKGLGLCSQGIVDLITLLGNQGTSGLKYKQCERYGDKAKNHKRIGWALPQSIPHIYHSFIKP
ncbi:hypothetical protein H5410_056330 [Solanum commersonii]|uniref:G-patch domain-containing protein n=1 Tax=Solanum commersonii TaxID=4109 RepID=A0A9J5WLY4_SOLCO|nr:hypothetical protein H5410_056330 [Solanum commersonii]